jgi:hypothetical protein
VVVFISFKKLEPHSPQANQTLSLGLDISILQKQLLQSPSTIHPDVGIAVKLEHYQTAYFYVHSCGRWPKSPLALRTGLY